MKKTTALLLATVVLLITPLIGLGAQTGPSIPRLTGRVVDQAGMISASAERQITSTLEALERSDSTQIAVLTVNSLEGESIEGFGIRVAEAWQIGTADQDNGAILIVSKADKKIRIEVGYGLEGNLTDLMSGRIIDNIISPAFKSGDFDAGFLNAVTAMTGVVQGEYTGDGKLPGENVASRGSGFGLPFEFGIFILFAVFSIISGLARGSRHRGARSGGSGLLWMALGMAAGSNRHRSSGFGGGFGSGGGGGFGGFSGGGGGFGGGGASGGW
jgi:uncharacterized protein